MKPIKFIVVGMTIYLALFTMMPVLNVAYAILFFFFCIGNALFLYMVYSVLKHGIDPKKKFSDGYWYSDIDKQYSKDA